MTNTNILSCCVKKTILVLFAVIFSCVNTFCSITCETEQFSPITSDISPFFCGFDTNELAPSLRSQIHAFVTEFMSREIMLSHRQVYEYIRNKVDEIGSSRLLTAMVSNVRIDSDIELISIPGLLKFTGLPAHVRIGRYYGKPVVYIDSDLYYNEDIRQHELDEIVGWETLRKVLGYEPNEMRTWILDNIENTVSDENLPPEYRGKTSCQIARTIHANSHCIDHLTDQHVKNIDYAYLAMLTAYDDEITVSKSDITIAARFLDLSLQERLSGADVKIEGLPLDVKKRFIDTKVRLLKKCDSPDDIMIRKVEHCLYQLIEMDGPNMFREPYSEIQQIVGMYSFIRNDVLIGLLERFVRLRHVIKDHPYYVMFLQNTLTGCLRDERINRRNIFPVFDAVVKIAGNAKDDVPQESVNMILSLINDPAARDAVTKDNIGDLYDRFAKISEKMQGSAARLAIFLVKAICCYERVTDQEILTIIDTFAKQCDDVFLTSSMFKSNILWKICTLISGSHQFKPTVANISDELKKCEHWLATTPRNNSNELERVMFHDHTFDGFAGLPLNELTNAVSLYMNNPRLVVVRYLLIKGDYRRLKALSEINSIGAKEIIAAFVLNNINGIITQTSDLILEIDKEEHGKQIVLSKLVPLKDKIGQNICLKSEIKNVFDAMGMTFSESETEKTLKELGFRSYDKGDEVVIIPIVYDNLLSAYRGSAETDGRDAAYLTHALTTAV